jgi:hypothetical protein
VRRAIGHRHHDPSHMRAAEAVEHGFAAAVLGG